MQDVVDKGIRNRTAMRRIEPVTRDLEPMAFTLRRKEISAGPGDRRGYHTLFYCTHKLPIDKVWAGPT
jgi:hypothetical protein